MNVHIHQFPSCIVIMAFNASIAGHTILKERILSINSGWYIWNFASNIFAIFETFSNLKIDYFSKLEFLDENCSFDTVCDLAHDSGQMATAKWQTKIKVEVMMILCVSSAKKNGFSGSTNGTYFPPPSVHISTRKKLAISRAYQLWSHFDSVEI